MGKYALNLEPETNRVLSICVVNKHTPDSMPRVDSFPEGDTYDYLYIDGDFVYSPLEKEEQ